MDITAVQIRLEVLKLAKDITEVNSIQERETAGPQRRVAYPQYSVDDVLKSAERLYDFVVTEKAAAA